jgi:4-alpha-glucanotransferase
MQFPRGSGILLHITSLPSRFGIGDLGPEAYRFVDFLAETGQSLWQMLPVGPTGYGNSPYQSLSSFAGNTLLLSLERLADEELLDPWPKRNIPRFSVTTAEFEKVTEWNEEQLIVAHRVFLTKRQDASAYEAFCTANGWWLEDYALFRALKRAHEDKAWTDWSPELVRRDPQGLEKARKSLHLDIGREKFLQFQFDRQWRALKVYANNRGVKLVGDVPIFAAHDSADVWAQQALFELNGSGHPTVIAGVPPDYFSTTGQRWGNPLYKWKVHAEQGFAWWTQRLRRALEQFDLIRIDHFRGFESYWEIPGEDADARGGRWVAGPGAAPFRAAEAALGPLPVIAEDLGVITPQVEALRDDLGFPGMRVLQFAFGDDPKSRDYQPHQFPRHCVVYTGTHDNNTTVGWFSSETGTDTTRTDEQIAREMAFTLDYLGTQGHEIHWDMIRAAWGSVADIAIAPLQDVLGLGAEARMNLPGSAVGNWTWRFQAGDITKKTTERLKRLTTVFDRKSTTTKA